MQLLILPTIPQEEPTKQQQLLHFFISTALFPPSCLLSLLSFPLLKIYFVRGHSRGLSFVEIREGFSFCSFLATDVYRSHNDIVHFNKQKPSKALHYISTIVYFLTTIMKIAALTLAAVVVGYAHAQQQAGSSYINEIKLMDGHKMRSKVVSPLPHT
jgi:hypothetical protein